MKKTRYDLTDIIDMCNPENVWVNVYPENYNTMTHMANDVAESEQIVDVRALPPPQRHNKIFQVFNSLKPGEALLVVNDHEPVHLVQFMKHERNDFDLSSYKAYQRGPREWIGVFKKKEITNDSTGSNIVFTSFDKERVLDDSAFSPVPVFGSSGYKVILAFFKAGQFIPVHTPSIDLVLLVHSGQGEVVAADKKFNVKPGDLVIIPKGEKRGIRAITDMDILHLVSPPPNDGDHEEVAKKISLGTFE